MVAHQNMNVGQASHQIDDAHRLRTAIDHIAQHVHGIVRTGGGLLERLVEGAQMPVGIGGDIRRHMGHHP